MDAVLSSDKPEHPHVVREVIARMANQRVEATGWGVIQLIVPLIVAVALGVGGFVTSMVFDCQDKNESRIETNRLESEKRDATITDRISRIEVGQEVLKSRFEAVEKKQDKTLDSLDLIAERLEAPN